MNGTTNLTQIHCREQYHIASDRWMFAVAAHLLSSLFTPHPDACVTRSDNDTLAALLTGQGSFYGTEAQSGSKSETGPRK